MISLAFEVTTDVAEVDLESALSAAVMQRAAETGLALLKRRITARSRRADGQALSAYKTRPISLPVTGIGTGSPLMKPRGGVLSESKKTMRFAGGYAEARAKAGRTTTKDFTLSGNLIRTLRVLRAGAGYAICGWPAGSLAALAAHGLDKQEGGKAFSWSAQEAESIRRVIRHALVKTLAGSGWTVQPPAIDLKDLTQ